MKYQRKKIVIAPSQLAVCRCAHRYKRDGVFLFVFGADGLKTFAQDLLLTDYFREHENKLLSHAIFPHIP